VTKRSLKHIAEKQDSELIRTMIDVCSNCDEIRLGKIKNRILLVKQIEKRDNRHYAVSLEERDDALIIVTVFPTDQKYLSNFDLLWRTGAS
jgi:hypothetical protein